MESALNSIKEKVSGVFGNLIEKAKELGILIFNTVKEVLSGVLKYAWNHIKNNLSSLIAIVNTAIQLIIGIIAGILYLGGIVFNVKPIDNTWAAVVEGWRDETKELIIFIYIVIQRIFIMFYQIK